MHNICASVCTSVNQHTNQMYKMQTCIHTHMHTHNQKAERAENTTAEVICESSGRYSWECCYLQIGFELEQS